MTPQVEWLFKKYLMIVKFGSWVARPSMMRSASAPQSTCCVLGSWFGAALCFLRSGRSMLCTLPVVYLTKSMILCSPSPGTLASEDSSKSRSRFQISPSSQVAGSQYGRGWVGGRWNLALSLHKAAASGKGGREAFVGDHWHEGKGEVVHWMDNVQHNQIRLDFTQLLNCCQYLYWIPGLGYHYFFQCLFCFFPRTSPSFGYLKKSLKAEVTSCVYIDNLRVAVISDI